MAELKEMVIKGPDPEKDGVVRWRCVDLRAKIASHFAVTFHQRSVAKLLLQAQADAVAAASLPSEEGRSGAGEFQNKLRQPDGRSPASICDGQICGGVVPR